MTIVSYSCFLFVISQTSYCILQIGHTDLDGLAILGQPMFKIDLSAEEVPTGGVGLELVIIAKPRELGAPVC